MAKKEGRIKIRFDVENIETLRELKDNLKGLKNAQLDVNIEGAKYKKLGEAIAASQDEISKATAVNASENGKLMKSYFSTGEELRRFYREQRLGNRTLREVSQTVGGLSSMFGGTGQIIGSVVGSFQQMEFTVAGLGIASQSAGGSMAVFGQKLMTMAVPIAAAAAAFALLYSEIAKTLSSAKELDAVLAKRIGLQVAAGEIPKSELIVQITSQLGVLASQRRLLDREFKEASSGFNEILTKISENENARLVLVAQQKALQNEIKADYRTAIELQIKGILYNGQQIEQERVMGKLRTGKTPDKRKYVDELKNEIYLIGQIATTQEDLAVIDSLKLKIQEVIAGDREEERKYTEWKLELEKKITDEKMRQSGEDAKRATTAEEIKAKSKPKYKGKDFEYVMKDLEVLQNSFYAGIDSMASSVSTTLGGAFSEVFGGAKTLAGSFVGSFVSSFTAMAMRIASAGILNMIFPGLGLLSGFTLFAGGGIIDEPVVGVGRSGRGYVFGESGSERVVPMAQSSRFSDSSGGMRPYVKIIPITDNQGLAVRVEIGQKMNSQVSH